MISAAEIFCLNELGGRANNEDFVSPRKGTATANDTLFIVCDGVGGEKKGEIASEIVCLSIQEYIKKEASLNGRTKGVVQNAIYYANEKLAAYVQTDPSSKRMSTTMALVLLGEDSVFAAWCGDTRIHHIRNGSVIWKSRDHSLVSDLVHQGELTEEEAKVHPKRNVITRSLNALNFNNMADYHEVATIEEGDYFLICTDGFLEKVNDKVISEVLMDEKQKDKASAFYTKCYKATRDNFSMYLVRLKKSSIGKNYSYNSSRIVLLVSLIIILLGIVFFLFIKIKG